MKRHELREHIFRIVFRLEYLPFDEMEEQIDRYVDSISYGFDEDVEGDEDLDYENPDFSYIREKCLDIFLHIEQIDASISKNSKGWSLDRMGKAEVAILRLAVYEMIYDDDIPVSVAINEAVELSKAYGRDEVSSPSFVNGILAKIASGEDADEE